MVLRVSRQLWILNNLLFSICIRMGTSVKEIKQNDRHEQVKYMASEEKRGS